MVLCIDLFACGVSYVLSTLSRQNETISLFGAVGFFVFLLPAFAYWLFAFFFGEDSWPLTRRGTELPPDERAFALLDEATKLEGKGRVKDALAKYQEVVDSFGGTSATRDAQKSIESLRARTG